VSQGTVTGCIEASGFSFTADHAGPSSGDLVLLLHGFPQSRYSWRAELPALAAAGFRACAPDQRGYSLGARPEGVDAYRTEHLVADVLALADALGGGRFHLVGHDWGGHLAWTTAALHPNRVRSVAVLSRPHPASFISATARDPKQAGRSSHHRSFQRPEATDELLREDAARLRGLFAQQGVPDEAADAYLTTLSDRTGLDAAVHWYRAVPNSQLQPSDVPAVVRPALYVWGDADWTVGREAAEGTRAFVSAPYRFVELPGIGHFITDQAPGVFGPLLIEHLQAHLD
jgi:pimeloyl-ACP methyl ester carboxylesterase